ncbi:MAG TPA: 2-oxo-4-hydroxy-4-carboxy-5-ureidoimidazoline decarboxylase, partial [Microvirga sp.]|nr:2-oxo-4-hydroxy-4-carboxy-5-ureidoimidazoline decarboxylase [Microvirga sp.]
RTKDEIMTAFEGRLEHDAETEFETAIVQIELIALLRLKDRLPSLADVFSNLA